jgi:hypothetical protein
VLNLRVSGRVRVIPTTESWARASFRDRLRVWSEFKNRTKTIVVIRVGIHQQLELTTGYVRGIFNSRDRFMTDWMAIAVARISTNALSNPMFSIRLGLLLVLG